MPTCRYAWRYAGLQASIPMCRVHIGVIAAHVVCRYTHAYAYTCLYTRLCVCMSLHVYAHAYAHVHLGMSQTYLHMSVCRHFCLYMSVCRPLSLYICMQALVFTCLYAGMYPYMSVCRPLSLYVCMQEGVFTCLSTGTCPYMFNTQARLHSSSRSMRPPSPTSSCDTMAPPRSTIEP